ncbi:MAG TPA: hypothetical protein VJK72_04010 [Candidatus Nanoarchaeia archaeon]|nr:hypothetical protein [Candidatus Nanoarchaeia archaeon]
MELFERSPVVDFASIKKHVKNDAYAKLLVHQLMAKGHVHKLAKGFYTKHSNPELAVYAFKPSYFGLQDALSFHNLWEQETIPVIITSRHVRTGIRNILGSNVLIRRLERKFIFGYEYVGQGNSALPYSDIEKTLIDMVYFKENIDGVVLKNILLRLNIPRLKKYLKDYDRKIRAKVLAFVNKLLHPKA